VTEYGHAAVDREKCFSYAICADVMADVFRLDEQGISVASPDAIGLLSTLMEVAADCPMQAISIFPCDERHRRG